MLALALSLHAEPGASAATAGRLPQDIVGLSRQLVIVLADTWDSTNAILYRFDLATQGWQSAAPPIPVSLGRSGLGWGLGLHPMPQDGPQKKEGDGRSPAGVFRLLYVFGKASPDDVQGLRMSYVQCTSTLECVDDPKSAYYNRVVDLTNVTQPDWHSAEKMAAPEEYRLGVAIDQNPDATPGAGSCVFLHVWGAPGKSTSGCTAMALGELEALVVWLDGSAEPLLVQLPKTEYAKFQKLWRLPLIPPASASSPHGP